MVPLRTIYQVCQAGWHARPIEQFGFLVRAENSLAHVARHAGQVIDQGTAEDPYSTAIGVELGLNPTTDFLYDLASDYIHHLKNTDPKAFKEFLRKHLGEDSVQEYETTKNVTINFNLKARHAMEYYGFLQQLPGLKKLTSTMSSIGINTQILADDQENGRQAIFAGLTSASGTPLRILVRQPLAVKQGVVVPDSIIG